MKGEKSLQVPNPVIWIQAPQGGYNTIPVNRGRLPFSPQATAVRTEKRSNVPSSPTCFPIEVLDYIGTNFCQNNIKTSLNVSGLREI